VPLHPAVGLFTVLYLPVGITFTNSSPNTHSSYTGEPMEVVTRNGEQKKGKKAGKEQIESGLKGK
jgi:hypothetical protein